MRSLTVAALASRSSRRVPNAGRRAPLGIPAVRLVVHVATPREERVVDDESVLELFVIVAVVVRQPERDREQSGRLRREIQARGVRAAHDSRDLVERGIVEAVLREQSVEAAEWPLVRELDPSTSNGTAPVSAARRTTSQGGTKRNSAAGSMKRLMSHGQATRSIFGRSRVTQRDARSPVTPRSGRLRTRGSACARHCETACGGSTPSCPPSMPPARKRAFQPAARSLCAASWPTSWPYTQ